jgi:hypothetical protein
VHFDPVPPGAGHPGGDAVVSQVNGESGHLEPGIRVVVAADDGLERDEFGSPLLLAPGGHREVRGVGLPLVQPGQGAGLERPVEDRP